MQERPPRVLQQEPAVGGISSGPARLCVVVAALVGIVLIGLVGLRPYVPLGDDALIEMGVRRLLQGNPPEIGPYSRFGWYHPGPAIYYLLWPGYLLTGSASWSLPLSSFVINGGCLIGVLAGVRREFCWTGAVWGGLVPFLYLLQRAPGLVLEPGE